MTSRKSNKKQPSAAARRKRAGRASRASEQWYRDLFISNPHPMWVYDLKTLRFLAVNDAAVAQYGYSRTEFLRMTIADIRPAKDVPRLKANVSSVTTGLDAAGVWEHRRKDGSSLEVEIVSHTLNFRGRKAELVLANDITARRQAQESLAAQNDIVSAVSESLATYVERGDWRAAMARLLQCALAQTESEYGFIGVVVADALRVLAHEGIVWDKTVNREFYDEAQRRYAELGYLEFTSFDNLFGRAITTGQPIIANDPGSDPRAHGFPPGHPPMHSFLGVPILVGPHAYGVVALANRSGGYTAQDQGRIEMLVRQAGGLCASYRQHVAALFLERERKEAEAAQRESEERLRLAVRASNVGLWDFNLVTNEVAYSSEWKRQLGYAEHEIGNEFDEWERRLHPEDAAAALRNLREYLADPRGPYETEFRLRHKDGSWRWIYARGEIQRDPAGRPARMLGCHVDITDRKRAEESLRENEQKLRRVMDGLGPSNFVGLLTTDGIVLEANRPALSAAGLTLEDVHGQPVEQTYWFSHSEAAQAQMREAVRRAAAGESSRFDIQIRVAEGKPLWLDMCINPLRDAEGRITHLVPSATVIDERKRAEETLRKSQAGLEAAQARARVGSWEFNPNTQTGAWSREMYRLFQCDPTLGMPSFAEFLELVHPEDRRSLNAAYATALKSGASVTVDFRTDPARLPLRFMTSTFESAERIDGRTVLMAGTTQDITERKQAEEHIRQLNRTYAVLSDINQLIVREREPSTVLDQACRIAVERGNFLLAWIGLVDSSSGRLEIAAHAGATPDTMEVLRRIIDDPQTGCAFTARALATGEYAVCNDIATDPTAASWREAALQRGYKAMASFPLVVDTLRIGTFNLYAGRAQFFDAEELRLLDELSRDIAFALEVCRRERERKALERQLAQSQKLQAIGTLAGGIAHDFNNVLAAILGNANLALHDLDVTHPARGSVREIVQAGKRARELVQRILTFSRPHEVELSPIRLRPIVEEAVKLLRSTLPAGIDLRFEAECNVPAVRADASQIHQVVLNLVTNAWHAIEGPKGNISIRLESCDVDAVQALSHPDLQPGAYVRLTVTDTGAGMDDATLARVFEPFFTTKLPGQGTGLGLSVVHGIVRGHGGAVTVNSRPGHGSTFSLYFPASQATLDTESTQPVRVEPVLGNGERILYLDDDEQLVYLAIRFLERMGYRVNGFTRAEDALAAFRATPDAFDLVITDYNMPGLSGLDVARELMSVRPDVHVVLTSGYVRSEEAEQARALGVREVVLKPNTIEDFAPIVNRLFADRRRA